MRSAIELRPCWPGDPCRRRSPSPARPSLLLLPLCNVRAQEGGAQGGKKKETKLGLTASKAGDFGEWYSQVRR